MSESEQISEFGYIMELLARGKVSAGARGAAAWVPTRGDPTCGCGRPRPCRAPAEGEGVRQLQNAEPPPFLHRAASLRAKGTRPAGRLRGLLGGRGARGEGSAPGGGREGGGGGGGRSSTPPGLPRRGALERVTSAVQARSPQRGSEQRVESRVGGVGFSARGDRIAGEWPRRLQPSLQVPGPCPTPRSLPAACLWRGGGCQGAEFQLGTCRGARSKPGLAPSVAPRDHALGRPGWRPPWQKGWREAGPAPCPRKCLGRPLSGLPTGGVGRCKGCTGRAQPGFAAGGKKAKNGECLCSVHLDLRDSAGKGGKDFVRAVVRKKDDSAALL